MKIYDISMKHKEGMIIYPRNPKFKLKQVGFMPKDSSNKSLVSFGTHTGTHVDSLRHISNKGKTIDKIDLKNLMGECKVLDLTKVNFEISGEDLKRFNINRGDIILIKSKNSLRGYKKFNKKFVHFDVSGARYLTSKKIKCVGVDYLSSGGHDVHKTFLAYDIPIVEGLDLSNVKSGSYDFICLPLNLIGAEASPARAILIKK